MSNQRSSREYTRSKPEFLGSTWFAVNAKLRLLLEDYGDKLTSREKKLIDHQRSRVEYWHGSCEMKASTLETIDQIYSRVCSKPAS